MTSSTDPTLALGRELAERFDDWDVLGRWMAHHVAELIEKARGSDDPVDQTNAAEMILQIWRQRHTLGDKHPLHNYDAIFNTLDYLGDRTAARRLIRQFGHDGPTAAHQNVSVPLQLAVRLEETVQDIQTWLVAEAAEEAEDQDAPWVALAREQRDNDEGRALRRIRRAMRAHAVGAEESEQEDDPVLKALDRAINLLTVLKDARFSNTSPPSASPPSDLPPS